MEKILLFAVALFFVWLGILSYVVYTMYTRFTRLYNKGDGKQGLKEVLDQVLLELSKNEKGYTELRDKIKIIEEESKGYIQNAGIVRFNPFGDTGGDQSFVLALLDKNKSGIVLTSLHSRGMTRWYAKNVLKGKGVDHDLSKEEEQAIRHTTKIVIKEK